VRDGSVVFPLAYRRYHGVEESLDEAEAVASPGTIRQPKCARVEKKGVVPVDVDIDKVECRLRYSESIVAAYPQLGKNTT